MINDQHVAALPTSPSVTFESSRTPPSPISFAPSLAEFCKLN
jgi:hypothetical protein